MGKISGESYQYELLDYLGEGGSGRVYKAFRYSLHGLNKEVVALKFLKTEKSIQELIEEYSVIKNLRSKYVLKVYGVERINQEPTLVMEYIDGLTWRQLFFRNIKEEDKSYLLSQLNQAVQSLNDEISFHGDISPSNIMISCDGDLRLIDFGNHYSDNRTRYITPEFVPDDVLNGSHYGAMTDMQSVLKIKDKYNIDEIDFNASESKKNLQKFVRIAVSDKTIALHNKPVSKASLKASISAAIFSVFMLLFIPTQAMPPARAFLNKATRLSIVSTKWKKIKINGKEFGFTPVNTSISTDKITIEWEGSEKSGRFVKQNQGGILRIGDKDFEP
ncbi:MAG: protein kinase family protein [Bdellovibrionales bacterium]|nr:protein kinase family protein [Bdellovibrionales bacterium]